MIADKAYDTDAILKAVAAAGALAVIPPKATRLEQRATDWQLYQQRHKIELLFGFMKHYRRVFARLEKLARRYLAFRPSRRRVHPATVERQQNLEHFRADRNLFSIHGNPDVIHTSRLQ